MSIKSLVLAIWCGIALTACAQNPAITNLSVADFATAIATDTTQIVDVRTAGEYQGGFIRNAKNIDQESKDFIAQMSAYDKQKPVYIYCLSGGRSGSAAKRLADAGFTKIFNLTGGVMAWRGEAKTLVINPPTAGAPAAAPSMTMAQFQQATSSGTVLVEFYAPWCGPCKVLKPIVQEIEREQSGAVKVLYIDIDKNAELADGLKLKQIPVIQVYKNGKRKWHNVGLATKEQIVKKLA
ncbi:MAG: hypothetical protein RL660_2625 [Bacteroidota bacterium]|jgi:thioredoxin